MQPDHKNYIDEYKYKIKSGTSEFNLYEFIKNKKVAVVGASPSLNGKGLGKYIDSFDVVIRINQGTFSSTDKPEDFGSRTDVLYLSQYARDRYTTDLGEVSPPVEDISSGSEPSLLLTLNSDGSLVEELPIKEPKKGMKISGFPKIFDNTKFMMILTQIKQDDFPPDKWRCYKCSEEIKHGEEYGLNDDWFKTQPRVGHLKCIRPYLDNYFKFYSNRTGVQIIVKDMAEHQKVFRYNFLTGILAVLDSIQYQASEVHLFGIDCYQALKDALRDNKKTLSPMAMYQEGYVVYEGTLIGNNGITHKDENGQQLSYLKKLYDYQDLFKTKIYIDANLKNIFRKTFGHSERFKKHEKDFGSFIRGKKVVVVGSGNFLNGKGLGSYLDTFDVVVRLNLGGNFCESNPTDFGKRTDITYINRAIRSHLVVDFLPFMRSSKYIVVESYSSSGGEGDCHMCKQKILKNQELYIDDQNLFSHQDCIQLLDYSLQGANGNINKVVSVDVSKLKKDVEEYPLVGLTAIKHMLDNGASQVSIVGFDFFQVLKEPIPAGGTIQLKDIYSEGYIIYGKLDVNGKDKNGKQLQYFKNLYDNNKNIINIIDTKLLGLL